jgi:hypothetical protein
MLVYVWYTTELVSNLHLVCTSASSVTAVIAGAGQEFLESVHYVSKVWLPAKQIVAAALAERHQVDPSGQIIVLKQVRDAANGCCCCCCCCCCWQMVKGVNLELSFRY